MRNFIYLDSDKLRSFSSQLFEGVTEYVSNSSASSKNDFTEQKGPVGSGRVVGDILSKEGSSTEYKFLEDHAYALFEQGLVDKSLLVEASGESRSSDINVGFVKVSSSVSIIDMAEVMRLLNGFNDFGQAMTRVLNHAGHLVKSKGKPLTQQEVAASAKDNDMQMDDKFLASLKYVLEFVYKDTITAEFATSKLVFSAPLKRSSLREDPTLLIQKHSRTSQNRMTLIGSVTQIGRNDLETEPRPDVKDASNLRQAMRFLSVHQKSLEDAFFGQQDNDIVVDPVAIYQSF